MTPDFKNKKGLLTQCSVCLRTIWTNTICHHGTVPTIVAGAPLETGRPAEPPPYRKSKPERRNKIDPFDDEDHS